MQPEPSAAMVKKKAKQLFSPEELPQAMTLLEEYGINTWELEPDRVRLGLLKLSKGNLELLRMYLETAHKDYRDILASAEYPNQMKHDSWKLDKEAAQALEKTDKQQYLLWLNDEH